MTLSSKTKQFRESLEALSREDLLEIIKAQDPELIKQINRIEWVFENKLNHLSWNDGTPVLNRQLSNQELALLIDEPFELDKELLAAGISSEHQRQLHAAKDSVVWAKQFLGAELRVYQILILRDPSLRKVLRAGRRLGKTFSLAIQLLHYSYTHKDGRSLVIAPMKTQVELIYQEILRISSKNEVVMNSISRKVTSPQFMIQFSNGSTIRFFTSGMKSGGKCLTPDHEVLTTNGWRNINQINVGEEILSWKDGQYFWDTVNNFWEYDYDNDLVVHDGKQISFSVTNNHKFAAKTRAPGSKWKDVEADNLKDYYIPTGSISPVAPSTNIFSKEELEIWGWWLSEGSGYIGKMSRISQTKIYGRERVCQLANTLNIHYTTPKKEIRIKWKPPIFSGINAYDKFIPRELMTENNLQGLLDGLLSGDGWIRRDGWEYSSSSYQLACDVQEIAVRLGLRASIREKNILYTPVKGGKPNRHWVVSAYPKTESILSKDNLKKIHYKGKVYCVTVPNTGYFLTRHNGLVHVTGNSDVARGQEAHLIILDEMDYMHADDLDALYAMLQKTAEDQPDKVMIGASTPTGRRERFWEWCNSPRFKEFWFPSYCNPFFSKEQEEEFREQYSSSGYRHEIEADWGEDSEGVYPRKFIDRAFVSPSWKYHPEIMSARSFHVIGVDWDKYGAGTNIVVLEVCADNYEDPKFRGKVRLYYREEISKSEYTLTRAVDRIIELNQIFNPKHIYVDRGYGEVQVELLRKHGVENPSSKMKERVKGIGFGESIEVRDPYTKLMIKKEMKPYMVDNLRQYLERENILFPEDDEEMYLQLISYVVVRMTSSGRPVFEAGGSAVDHAHDALMLALLAITQNYGDFARTNYADKTQSFSNEFFMTKPGTKDDEEEKSPSNFITGRVQALSTGMSRKKNSSSRISRKMF
jgi:hypothetical protein